MTLTVTPIDGCIGARVTGLNLHEALVMHTFAGTQAAWMQHKVLVLPDQNISDDEHVAFATRFGELEIHHQKIIKDETNPAIFKVSNVDENNQVRPPSSDVMTQLLLTKIWHTDSSFREVPCMGSILRGLEVVDEGGQTCFTNMAAVLEGLPADLLAKIEGKRCRHDFAHLNRIGSKYVPTAEEKLAMPPIWQPMIRVHPVTGQKSLYISPIYNDAIEGMDDAEAKEVLDQLYEICSEPRFVYEHTWTQYDILMWDNRSTMHRILPYDPAARRVSHRTTIVGDGPVMAA